VIPAFLLPDVTAHLAKFTAADSRALVFTGPKGAQLRRSNFSRAGSKATAAADLSGFHFHDRARRDRPERIARPACPGGRAGSGASRP
jgi:hypothetical protein